MFLTPPNSIPRQRLLQVNAVALATVVIAVAMVTVVVVAAAVAAVGMAVVATDANLTSASDPSDLQPLFQQLPLMAALQAQSSHQRLRCHVPGHAGQGLWPKPRQDFDEQLDWLQAVYPYDLTELPGLDVLSDPEDVLKESQALVAQAYGAAQSFYLVNGASVGLMAALLALGRQQTVLVARNCHRCVVQGLILGQHTPVWILPTYDSDWQLWGGLSVDALETAYQANPQASALVMTHPTYEGASSPLVEIAQWCHQRGLKLIVDEAHGTLWPLIKPINPQWAANACSALNLPTTIGAAVVVHSAHKSAGSLTQTAVLHRPHGSPIAPEDLQAQLNLLHTSSPSYVLLASLEATLLYWASSAGLKRLTSALEAIEALHQWAATALSQLQIHPHTGPFHWVMKAEGVSGQWLAETLETKFDIAFEAYGPRSVLLLIHPSLPPEALAQLKATLIQLDQSLTSTNRLTEDGDAVSFQLPMAPLTPAQAFEAPGRVCSKNEAIGAIAKSLYAPCPPGIPVVVPGEQIEASHHPWLPQELLVVQR